MLSAPYKGPVVEEVLYPAMEDFQLDLIIGEGPSARSVRIDLPAFTLVGATTRSGLLTTPLRDRFGIQMRMQFYDRDELILILNRQAIKRFLYAYGKHFTKGVLYGLAATPIPQDVKTCPPVK